MNRNELAAVVAACLTVVSAALGPVYIVSHNSTERTAACVKSGGQYLHGSEAECKELARVAKLAAAEAYELDQENMRLHVELAEAELLAGTGRVPSLRVVPNGGQS